MSMKRLRKAVLMNSVSDRWYDAALEWTCIGIQRSKDPHTCICGHHPIYKLCHIVNERAGTDLIVGNCCVSHFYGVDSSIYNSLFAALKERKLSRTVIDFANDMGYLNCWEFKFLNNVFRKRIRSNKCQEKYDKITERVLGAIEYNSKDIFKDKSQGSLRRDRVIEFS